MTWTAFAILAMFINSAPLIQIIILDFAAYNRSEHSEQRGGDYHGNADRLSIVSSPLLHFNKQLH